MIAASLVDFGGRRRTPVIVQSEGAECGLACLAMIASHHGYRTDLATLRRRHPTSQKGCTLADLAALAGCLGLATRALKAPLEELGELALPAILHWDFNHFVVLTRIRRGRATLHDPARGARQVDLEEMSRHYTGIAMELTPTHAFVRRTERQRIGIGRLVGPLHGLAPTIARIVVLALTLEIFALASPFFMQMTVDDAIVAGDRDLLTVLGGGFLLLLALQVGTALLRSWVVMVLGTTVEIRLVTRLFRHLLTLPMSWFERRHLGDVTSRFESLNVIQRTLTTTFLEAIIDGVMALSTLCMMAIYSGPLALVVCAAAAAYAVLRIGSYRWLRAAKDEQIAHAARQNSSFLETVRGIQTVKLFGAEGQRRNLHHNLLADNINAALRGQRQGIVHRAANSALFGVENIAVVWLGALTVLDGHLTVGMLFAFIAFKQQFTARTAGLVDKAIEIAMLGLHSERVADIALSASDAQVEVTQPAPRPVDASVELHNLGFRYSERDPWVVRNVDLRIEAGESVALVGASGCGKTTLLKVILGLMPASEGEVRIGGVEVGRLGPARRRLVATVMQEDQLFAGSVADNICFFAETPEQDRIESCAELAAVHADITAMPMGYNTLIGDMGTVLSGGQKQRILLARALYRRPRILILDEATSHLDVVRERQVNQAIAGLRLTRIIVAHRPETIASADRVVVIGPHSSASEQAASRPMSTPSGQRASA